MVEAERSACRSDGYKQMRALICHTFAGYDFDTVDELCADDLAEVVGAALWVKDQEARGVKKAGRKSGRKR